MPSKSWELSPGLNNVGSYQVSGRPFATGAVDAMAFGGTVVNFPTITNWVEIFSPENLDLRIGFSHIGVVSGSNYVVLKGNPTGQISQRFHIKVSEIHLSGSNVVHVLAGLTNIPAPRCIGVSGSNWSGSVGVDSHKF